MKAKIKARIKKLEKTSRSMRGAGDDSILIARIEELNWVLKIMKGRKN